MNEAQKASGGSRLGFQDAGQAIANERPENQSINFESQRVCRICASNGPHSHFVVREMMFGTREPFGYFECANCKTLQIVDIPPDLARHYPGDYLGSGLTGDGGVPNVPRWGLTTFLKRQRFAYVLHRRNVLGLLLLKWRRPDFPYSLH